MMITLFSQNWNYTKKPLRFTITVIEGAFLIHYIDIRRKEYRISVPLFSFRSTQSLLIESPVG